MAAQDRRLVHVEAAAAVGEAVAASHQGGGSDQALEVAGDRRRVQEQSRVEDPRDGPTEKEEVDCRGAPIRMEAVGDTHGLDVKVQAVALEHHRRHQMAAVEHRLAAAPGGGRTR